MKFLLTALVSLVAVSSVTAFASNGYNVKVSDGGAAHCKTKADVVRGRFGAYKTHLKSIVVDGNTAEVKIETILLSCIEKDDKIGFSEVRPYDTLSYQTVTFNNGIQTLHATPEQVKMIAYKDGVYKKLANVELTNEHKQIVTLKLELDDLLSAEEREDLENGKVVLGNFDYTLQKTVKIGDKDYSKRITFGAFRIHFEAFLDKDYTLKIIVLK